MSASPAAVRSNLPASVRRQVENANRLVEQLNAPPQAAPAAPQAAAPAPAPATPAPAPAAPAPPQPPAEDATEHKYRVLQGKYNAEVPRLQKQLNEQEQLIKDMRQQLTNAQTMLASLSSGQPAPNAQPPAQPAARRVKDEEIRQFGPDLYDFIKRTSLEAVEPELTKVAQPIQQRLAKTEQAAQTAASTVAADAVQKMYTLLNDKVPDWTVVNEQPEFLAWLSEVDPYAGAPRGQLLSQAYQANDGPRVVAFFLGFKNENAAISPPQETAPPAAPAAPGPEAQLLQLVAPGTPKSGPASGAPNDAGKRIWTRTDVQNLYAKINEFTRKNKPVPVELRQLETDLIRAQAEQRLRV